MPVSFLLTDFQICYKILIKRWVLLLSKVFRPEKDARFFFYCQHIIKILFIVCCMIYKQPGFKYIISNRYIIFIHRRCEPYIVSILAISSVFIMFIFSVFFVCRIGCILYQFRDCYRSVCFRFCLSPHKRFPMLRLCKFFR